MRPQAVQHVGSPPYPLAYPPMVHGQAEYGGGYFPQVLHYAILGAPLLAFADAIFVLHHQAPGREFCAHVHGPRKRLFRQ